MGMDCSCRPLLLLLPQARVNDAADTRTIKAQNRFMGISFANSNPLRRESLDFIGHLKSASPRPRAASASVFPPAALPLPSQPAAQRGFPRWWSIPDPRNPCWQRTRGPWDAAPVAALACKVQASAYTKDARAGKGAPRPDRYRIPATASENPRARSRQSCALRFRSTDSLDF